MYMFWKDIFQNSWVCFFVVFQIQFLMELKSMHEVFNESPCQNNSKSHNKRKVGEKFWVGAVNKSYDIKSHYNGNDSPQVILKAPCWFVSIILCFIFKNLDAIFVINETWTLYKSFEFFVGQLFNLGKQRLTYIYKLIKSCMYRNLFFCQKIVFVGN